MGQVSGLPIKGFVRHPAEGSHSNAHGIPNGKSAEFYKELKKNELNGYPQFGKTSRETYMGTGFIDRVCPPTSVYAAYNNLPKTVKKHMQTTPDMGHNAPRLKYYTKKK